MTEATELVEIFIDKVAHAGMPAHQESDTADKKGFTGAKILMKKDQENDPHNFITALVDQGFTIKETTAEVSHELPRSVILKDYISTSGSISTDDGDNYISYTVSSGREDPTGWVMHLKDTEGKTTGVQILFGIEKDLSKVRTIFFDKTNFTDTTAKEWIEKHLPKEGAFEMQLTKEELQSVVVEGIKTVLPPMLADTTKRIEELEKNKGIEVKEPTDEEKVTLEDQAKKDREELVKTVVAAVKAEVPTLIQPLVDRVDKIAGTVLGTQTGGTTKDVSTPGHGFEVISENDTHELVKKGKWQSPMLSRLDFQLVEKGKAPKSTVPGLSAEILKSIDKTLQMHHVRG